MDKILHYFKYLKLWELWYIPFHGSCRILSINRSLLQRVLLRSFRVHWDLFLPGFCSSQLVSPCKHKACDPACTGRPGFTRVRSLRFKVALEFRRCRVINIFEASHLLQMLVHNKVKLDASGSCSILLKPYFHRLRL